LEWDGSGGDDGGGRTGNLNLNTRSSHPVLGYDTIS